MAYPIRITTFCKCGRLIVTIATEYKTYNQDNTLHTCGGTMHLTYRDCSEYIRCTAGDESFSRCKFTGTYCVADEAGEQCSMWEEEKAEILREDMPECQHTDITLVKGYWRCNLCRRAAEFIGPSDYGRGRST